MQEGSRGKTEIDTCHNQRHMATMCTRIKNIPPEWATTGKKVEECITRLLETKAKL